MTTVARLSVWVPPERQGQMWFGSIGGGVSRYDGELFTTFTTRDGLAGNDVLCILENRSGRLWLGTADGVSRWDGQRFVNFSPDYADERGLNRANIGASETVRSTHIPMSFCFSCAYPMVHFLHGQVFGDLKR